MPNQNLSGARSTLEKMFQSLERQGAIIDELKALNSSALEIVESMELPDED